MSFHPFPDSLLSCLPAHQPPLILAFTHTPSNLPACLLSSICALNSSFVLFDCHGSPMRLTYMSMCPSYHPNIYSISGEVKRNADLAPASEKQAHDGGRGGRGHILQHIIHGRRSIPISRPHLQGLPHPHASTFPELGSLEISPEAFLSQVLVDEVRMTAQASPATFSGP